MPRFDPRAALRSVHRDAPPYEALDDPEEIAAQFGIPAERIAKLDGNENPYGPSPRALEVLRNVRAPFTLSSGAEGLSGDPAAPGWRPNWYGDAEQRNLRRAIGGWLGIDIASIVCGAGSDELIDLAFRCFVDEGDRIVTASPTFGMYAFDAKGQGAEVVDVPLIEADWSLDTEALIDAASQAKAVFLPSPNNPTGNALPAPLVDRLLATGALLVVDEAYIEFSHEESLARRAATEPGLLVLRTFSKWAGLAGLRVGYGVMAPEVAEIFRRAQQPYTVNSAAEAAAIASIEDRAILDERACLITGERDRMIAALHETGWVTPYASEASFVLMRFALDGRPIEGLPIRDALRRRGIFVRHFGAPRLRDCLRISIGLPEENDRVIEALAEIRVEIEAELEAAK